MHPPPRKADCSLSLSFSLAFAIVLFFGSHGFGSRSAVKMHSYRTHVAEEILSTERLYVNQLFELVHVPLPPLSLSFFPPPHLFLLHGAPCVHWSLPPLPSTLVGCGGCGRQHFLHPLRDANASGKPILSDAEVCALPGRHFGRRRQFDNARVSCRWSGRVACLFVVSWVPQIRQIFSTVEIILATNKDLLEAPLVKRVEQQWFVSLHTHTHARHTPQCQCVHVEHAVG